MKSIGLVRKGMRGFTLIELLVVIAIIGLLSAVVIASLNSARAKGADAAIKSTLVSARSQAELYYSTGNTYAGVCAAAATSNGILDMKNSATASGSGAVVCNDAAGAYALQAQLKSVTSQYFCVDSTGKASTSTTALSTNTVCP